MQPSSVVAGRQMRIEGAYNVRDLGGLPAEGGHITRWRRLLRSDLLANIPKEPCAALVDYGVRTAIDLRQSDELASHPSMLASTPGITYLQRNLLGDDELPAEATDYSRKGIANSYAWTLRERRSVVRDTLAALAQPGATPAVFFCAGGTDRTGMIAALLLGIAGVPHETIAADYHLSARGLADRFAAEGPPHWMEPDEQASERALNTLARPETMLLTLEYLDESFGGTEGYVRAIGLTPEQASGLKKALLD